MPARYSATRADYIASIINKMFNGNKNYGTVPLEYVSDTEDVPERSFVLYPNTLHFEGDDLFVVSITSELDEIGHDDLQNVFISIGVPTDE